MLQPQRIDGILSGRDRDLSASLLRFLAALAEPVYTTAMAARNRLYDQGAKRVRHLARPVVSVGNITTGGTGKTPLVAWLANRMRSTGRRPAILMRGYAAQRGLPGDEQTMLEADLNSAGTSPPIAIAANANRVAAADEIMGLHPEIDLFILDDGFQHRRVARDMDIVLIDATKPFGFDRVFPRGLLREPLRGLARAHAFVITRNNLVDTRQRTATEDALRRLNPSAPIFHASCTHTAFRTPDERRPLADLAGQSFLAVAGIANPHALETQLAHLPGQCVGTRFFPDHHPYCQSDLSALLEEARHAKASVLLTTGKDWPKLARLSGVDRSSPPIWRLELSVEFEPAEDSALLDMVQELTAPAVSPRPRQATV